MTYRRQETEKRLINIEGIDCSGKTTLSKMLTNRLNAESTGSESREWVFEHEPRFSSEDADRLNFNVLDGWQREFYFMKDRISHQHILNTNNVVLDRYILSGLAYAKAFSPETVPMMLSVYHLVREFKQPDVIVFIDIEPENALKFNELKKGTPDYSTKMTLNNLQLLRDNFKFFSQTMREWEIPFVVVHPVIGDLNATLDKIYSHIKNYI